MLLPSFQSTVLPLVSFVSLTFVVTCHGQLDEGSNCDANGSPGICKILWDCAPAYEQLRFGKRPDQICGFSGFDPIVCCPESGRTTPTTPRASPQDPPLPEGKGGIAREKCIEYGGDVVYSFQVPPTQRRPTLVNKCLPNMRKFVIGGKKTNPQEFPHMAAIGYNSDTGIRWLCGGSLISERFVMTAAHCTYSADFLDAEWVRLGDQNLIRDDDNAKPRNFRVIERLRHPRYRRPSEYHDIALLKLESDVDFNNWIRPACLPYYEPDILPDDMALATGWGRVDWSDEEGSADLMKVTLGIVPQTKCNASFIGTQGDSRLQSGIVDEWQLCAGQPGKDTCQGDSGGPLNIFNNDVNCMYTIVGITSLGKICGSITPGIYTRVKYYIPWIESVVWPNA